jgi:DNA-directed RNA polymerase subunit RPC12/RpoP
MDAKVLNPIHHRCGTCGEIFPSLKELCAHAQAHTRTGRYPAQRQTAWEQRPVGSHGLEYLPYACRTCGAIFLSAEEVNAHAQVHALHDRMRR